MRRMSCIVLAAVGLFAARPAFAQIIPEPPELMNRIPQPLPTPEKPPIINGPLGQNPPPGVYNPSRLTTHSNRTTACQHEGAGYGLRGARLQAYVRSCGNAN